MPDDAPTYDGTALDPVGAIIFYLCVTQAIEAGTLVVPSSRYISNRLRASRDSSGRDMPTDQIVRILWEDLWWLNERKLLFNEHVQDRSVFFRALAQHNVNARIRHFQPGFRQVHSRERRIMQEHLVEKAVTAVRLVALKELYYFNRSELPHTLLLRFLLEERLIPSPEQFFTFVETVRATKYVTAYAPGDWSTTSESEKVFMLEPSQIFRNQDMYIELRALDFFSPDKPDEQRRVDRAALHEKARAFIERLQSH